MQQTVVGGGRLLQQRTAGGGKRCNRELPEEVGRHRAAAAIEEVGCCNRRLPEEVGWFNIQGLFRSR